MKELGNGNSLQPEKKKKKEILSFATTWVTLGYHAKRNKLITERRILPNSTYIIYLTESNSQDHRVEWWLPGSERRGKWRVTT